MSVPEEYKQELVGDFHVPREERGESRLGW